MRPLPWLGLGILALTIFTSTPTVAQDSKAQARQHFEKGKNLYDAGDFAPALAEFKEAFNLKDDPAFLFNMGQCHAKLGNDAAALHAYKSYLRRKPDAPNRAQVETRIAELEERQRKSDGARPTEPAEPTPAVTSPVIAPSIPAPAASPGLDLTSSSPSGQSVSTPIYKTWWFWTGVGVVVAGGVAAAILLSRGSAKDGCSGEPSTCVRL
jgi:tetratricopeptide (TPR) repeat protein